MKMRARLLMAGLVGGLTTSLLSSAVAGEKAPAVAKGQGKATRALLAESDKFQVLEIHQKPGEVTVPTTSGTRVVRALQGGILLRTYADGKTEKHEWKAGEVQIQEPGPDSAVTNVGTSDVVLHVVRLK